MKKSNIELLRIIAAILVIIIHVTSVILTDSFIEKYTITWYYGMIMRIIAAPAIVIFLLLSGYVYGISKKKKDIKKTIKRLLFPVCFYLPLLVISDYFMDSHSVIQTINNFLHFTGFFHHLWYIYIYILIVFIVYNIDPYIKIEKTKISKVVVILLLLISFAFTYQLLFHNLFLIFYYIKNEFMYTLLIYVFGIMVGRYDIKVNRLILISCYFISIIALIIFYLYLIKHDPSNSLIFVISYTNIFNMISAISLFLLFKDLNIKSKWINAIGSLTYGCYIIHVLLIVAVKKIYSYPLNNHYKYYWLYDISVIVLVFLGSILIEYIRQIVFEEIQLKCKEKKN